MNRTATGEAMHAEPARNPVAAANAFRVACTASKANRVLLDATATLQAMQWESHPQKLYNEAQHPRRPCRPGVELHEELHDFALILFTQA